MRKTTLKILSILMLTSLLGFVGCNDDDSHNHKHEAIAGIKSTKISFNDFKKHTKAFNLVTEVNKKQSQSNLVLNKIIKDTINNFTIDTQEGLYLQYANLHSFTFPIQREVDNGKIENLVLSYQNDGSYKVKILKYDLTPQEKADLELNQLKTIQNPIVTIPIENFDTNLVVNGCEFYTETVYIYCSSGDHSFGNGTGFDCSYWANLSDGTPPRLYTVSKMRCLVDNGGSNGGGDSGVNTGGGATDGDNNYPPEYPTAQTDPEEYEEGISAVVKPSLDSQPTPCKELITNSQNADFKTKMQALHTNISGTLEKTFGIANGTLETPATSNPVCGAIITGTPQESGEVPYKNSLKAIAHNHLEEEIYNHIGTFTPNDIIQLSNLVIMAEQQGSAITKNEFASYLVCKEGNYSIKVSNIDKLYNFAVKYGTDDDFFNEINEYYKDNNMIHGKETELQNVGFLKLLRDYDIGIDYYEADENFENWKKLNLGFSPNNIIKTPC